jgi:hypothetical protein
MWIGSNSYATIKEWVEEALAQGVSKRLPNAAVARPLTEPGTVVFVAHDEGNYHDCPECMAEIECPECRLRSKEIERIEVQIEELRVFMAKAMATPGSMEPHSELAKKLERTRTKIRKRNEKIQGLEFDLYHCECDGKGIEAGSGGNVEFNSGVTMDYRKYNYYLHQPASWTPEMEQGVKVKHMCENCGGTGRLPDGMVFGLFVPNAVEYILRAEDDEKVQKQMKKDNIRIVNPSALAGEVKRKCGLRKNGGVYVVTDNGSDSTQANRVAKRLISKGVIKDSEVTVTGNFIEFLKPVEIDSKRFRGIKRWGIHPDVEDEAEMALDALN